MNRKLMLYLIAAHALTGCGRFDPLGVCEVTWNNDEQLQLDTTCRQLVDEPVPDIPDGGNN